ncbi:MvdC/MvdD family ATP grasp protein [Streptomyces sp. NPDC056647]|uniref:MvdC/MvdD family ATP grasp protein n=1 Tax=unclassified Streptomyces TaxID=2593676 RepID=UPI0036C56500
MVTQIGDSTADRVLDELYGRGVPAVRLDPCAESRDGSTSLAGYFDATGMKGAVRTSTRELDLENVRSVYWRRPTPSRRPGEMETVSENFIANETREGFLGLLGSLPGAFYVNHPWRIRDAEYKPAQLATAAHSGFAVPHTLVTNNEAQARTFVEIHGQVIYKALWGVEVLGEDEEPLSIWASSVRLDELDERVRSCPHLFQARVPKVADVRLVVVGDEFIATRIDTSGNLLDWRLDPCRIYTPIDIPDHIQRASRRYMQVFQLVYGAFDFALTSDGRWIFLECNPNGQWAFVDPPAVRRITVALANALTELR